MDRNQRQNLFQCRQINKNGFGSFKCSILEIKLLMLSYLEIIEINGLIIKYCAIFFLPYLVRSLFVFSQLQRQ
jgi:hypothetical protein